MGHPEIWTSMALSQESSAQTSVTRDKHGGGNYLRAAAAAADPAKGRLQHRGKLRGPPGVL